MLRILIIAALLFPATADAHKRRFSCPELRGLTHNSADYRDTLQACIWDFRHPDRSAIVH